MVFVKLLLSLFIFYGFIYVLRISTPISALEDLDSLLLRATRENGSASVEVMKTRVSTAVTALDK